MSFGWIYFPLFSIGKSKAYIYYIQKCLFMKKLLRILLYIFILIAVLIGGALAYLGLALPNVGKATDLKVEITPERVARGEYLAKHVFMCADCHSKRDWTKFSGPITPGTLGQGGEVFSELLGLPGRFVVPNITPHHLKDWTDGEIFRAITTGVSKDGHALFPVMPYQLFRIADSLDIISVIAYIRTLQPINTPYEKSKANFPVNFIMNTFPQKAALTPKPDTSDRIAYGKYLSVGCMKCHTAEVDGKVVGKPYAGGSEFKMFDGGVVRSMNITPDKETGIGGWTKAEFLERFEIYNDSSYVLPKVGPGDFQTVMPWTMYAGLKKSELEDIYDYLRTVPPVKNQVIKYSPPPK